MAGKDNLSEDLEEQTGKSQRYPGKYVADLEKQPKYLNPAQSSEFGLKLWYTDFSLARWNKRDMGFSFCDRCICAQYLPSIWLLVNLKKSLDSAAVNWHFCTNKRKKYSKLNK